jgi:hypothetical protein
MTAYERLADLSVTIESVERRRYAAAPRAGSSERRPSSD